MARKTQISKQVILQTAFQRLIRDGYASISITSLAKEIGCSTQPIAWHFGNMEGFRKELLDYSLNELRNRFSVEGECAADIMYNIAENYIALARGYPNLYQYFYMNDQDGQQRYDLARTLRSDNYQKLIELLRREYSVSEESAKLYIMNLQMYVHGIASFIVAKVLFWGKEEIMEMIRRANEAFLTQMKENR